MGDILNSLPVPDELFDMIVAHHNLQMIRFDDLPRALAELRRFSRSGEWFEQWGRFLPEHSTAVSLLDRLLHHNNVVANDGESYRMREARTRPGGRHSKR